MELRPLRAFVAIVDAGGFARAASRVHVSQPALSRQIRALESEFGVRVFDRIGRRVRLTVEGEDLLRRARRLLADADSLHERARALTHGQAGVLRVGATAQTMSAVLAGFLVPYRRRHPEVDIQLVEDGGARLPMRLEHGEVQLALMLAGDARFRWRILAPIHLLAVVPARHPLGRRATVDVEQLADAPLLVPRPEFLSRHWLDAACQAAHVRPRLLLESGSLPSLAALARAGYGIAIVPSNTPVPRRGVSAPPVVRRGAAIGGWLSVSWDPRRFLPSYADRFIDELAAYARRFHPGRHGLRLVPRLPRPPTSG